MKWCTDDDVRVGVIGVLSENTLDIALWVKSKTTAICPRSNNKLKRHNQAKIIKKSVFLFSLLNMAIRCENVHRVELRKFFYFCVAHLPVKRDIKTGLPYFLLWTYMSEIKNRKSVLVSILLLSGKPDIPDTSAFSTAENVELIGLYHIHSGYSIVKYLYFDQI